MSLTPASARYLGMGRRTGFGHAGAHGPRIAQDHDVPGRDSQPGVIDPPGDILERFENDGRPTVREQIPAACRRLENGPGARAFRGVPPASRPASPGRRETGSLLATPAVRACRPATVPAIAPRPRLWNDPGAVQSLSTARACLRRRACRRGICARWLTVDQHRGPLRGGMEIVERQANPTPAGDRGQVDDGVGRAADGTEHGQRIPERRLGQDLLRA